MKKVIAIIASSLAAAASLAVAVTALVFSIIYFVEFSFNNTYRINFYLEQTKQTLLYTTTVDDGKEVAYDYASKGDPVKPSDDTYTYTFVGWTDGATNYAKGTNLPNATKSMDYYAYFSSTEKPPVPPVTTEYTVNFVAEDGQTILFTQKVKSGAKPESVTAPLKNDYKFSGWELAGALYTNETFPVITANTTFKATYELDLKPVDTDTTTELDNIVESEDPLKLYEFTLSSSPSSNKEPLVLKIGDTALPVYVLNDQGEYELKEDYVPLNGEYSAYISKDYKLYLIEPESVYELRYGVSDLTNVVKLVKDSDDTNLWVSSELTLAANTQLLFTNYTKSLTLTVTADENPRNVVGNNMKVTEAGKYIIALDVSTNKVLVISTIIPPEPTKDVYLVGTFNSWQKVDASKLALADDIYSISLTLKKGDKFKLQIEDAYYGYADLLENKNYLSNDNDSNIIVNAYGNYLISFDSNNKISVSLTDNYTLQINNGTSVSMSLDMENTNADLQYSLAITASAGDILTFNVAAIDVSEQGNNVRLNSDNKIEVITAITNVKAYLKASLNSENELVYSLWVGGYVEPEPVYTLNNQQMVVSTEDVPADVTTQYELELNLTKGLVLAFAVDGQALEVEIENGANNAKLVNNEIKVIVAKENAKVFLKKYVNADSETYKLWVSGYEDIYYLGDVVMTKSTEDVPEGYTQYELTKDLAKNEVLEFMLHDAKLNVAIIPSAGENMNNARLYDGEIRVIAEAAQAHVYLKKENSTGNYSVWVGGFTAVTYVYKLNDQEMTISTEDVPTDVACQYELTLDLTKGLVLAFSVDDLALEVAVDEGANNAKLVGEEIKVIVAKDDAKVFLKKYVNASTSEESYKVWVEGYVDIYYLGESVMTLSTENVPEGCIQYELELDLEKNQELTFKLHDDLLNVVIVESTGENINNAKVVDGKIVTIVSATATTVYLKKEISTGNYSVWVGGYSEHEFIYKVNDEVMSKSTHDVPTDVKEQFEVEMDLTTGQELAFELDGEALAVEVESGKNNVKVVEDKIKVIVAKEGAKVFLKKYVNSTTNVESYKVWVEGYVDTYYLGENVMTKSTENVPEGYTQYELTTTLTKDDELSFKLHDEVLEVTPETCFGNNINSELKVIDTAENVKVFLKVKNDTGAYSVWAEGFVEEYLNGTVKLTDASDEKQSGDTWVKQFRLHKDFEANEELAITFKGNALEFRSVGGNATKSDTGKITVTAAATNADAFVKRFNDNGQTYYELWVSESIDKYTLRVLDQDLVLYESSKPTDAAEQYFITLDVVKNQELVFKHDTTTIEVVADTTSGNNAKTESGVTRVITDATSADIYLKKYSNGEYKVWVEGYVDKYYMGESLMTLSTKDVPSGFTQYELETNLTKDQELVFKLHDELLTVVAEAGFGNNVTAELRVIDAAENVKVFLKKNNTSGEYEVWVKGYVEEYFIGEEKMVNADDEKPSGVDEQFKLSLDILANEIITITLRGEAITLSEVSGNATLSEGKIKVTNDARNASIYLKRTASTFKAYVSETVEKYFVNDIEMVKSINTPSGVTAQYEATLDVDKDDEVIYKLFDDAVSNIEIEAVFGNNLKLDGTKLIVINDAIEVKTYLKKCVSGNDVTYKVILEGYEPVEADYNTYYVYVDPSWLADGATIEGYASTSTDGKPADWLTLTPVEGSANLFTVKIYKTLTKFIVCRIKSNPTDLHDWDKKDNWLWTQTIDVVLSQEQDLIMTGGLVGGTTTTTKYKEYTITIDVDGGTAVTNITAYPFAPITKPTTTKEHYAFTKWVYADNHNVEYVFTESPVMVAADIEILAIWTPEEYEVTLHIDNAAIKEGKTVTGYTYGVGATLPTEDDIVVTGNNHFDGWYTLDGTGDNWGDKVEAISTTDFGNKELYAKISTGFIVSFNQNLENEEVETFDFTSYLVTDGAGKTTLSSVVPTTIGYTFVIWNTQANGEGYAFDPSDEITVTGATTLYAIWSINKYTVNFKNFDGTLVGVYQVDYKASPAYEGETLTKQVGGYPYALYAWVDMATTTVYKKSVTLPVMDGTVNEINYQAMFDSITASINGVAQTLVEEDLTGTGNDLHQYKLTTTVDKTNTLVFKNNDDTLAIHVNAVVIDEYHPINGTYTVYITGDYNVYLAEPENMYALIINDGAPINLPANPDKANEWFDELVALSANDVLKFVNTTRDEELTIAEYSGELTTATVVDSANYKVYLKLENNEYKLYTAIVQSINPTKVSLYTSATSWGSVDLTKVGSIYRIRTLLDKNDEILIRINDTNTWNYRYNNLTLASKQQGYIIKGAHDNDHNDDNVKVTVAGYYNIEFDPETCALSVLFDSAFTVKVGDQEAQNMAVYMEGASCDVQFRVAITGDLGDELVFAGISEVITPENNCNVKLVGGKLLLASSVNDEYIYLKLAVDVMTPEITYTLYLGGYHDMYFANDVELEKLANTNIYLAEVTLAKDATVIFYKNNNCAKEAITVTLDNHYGNVLVLDNTDIVTHNAVDNEELSLIVDNTSYVVKLEGFVADETEFTTYYVHLTDDFIADNTLKVFGFVPGEPKPVDAKEDEFVDLTLVANSSNLYSFKLHNSHTSFLVARTKSEYTGEWSSGIWNNKEAWFLTQTVDITIGANNLFIISDLTDKDLNQNVNIINATTYTDHTITFMNGGVEVENSQITAKPYKVININDLADTTTHEFDGWYNQALTEKYETANYLMPASNVIMYAKWNAKSYSVNLHLNFNEAPAATSVSATYGLKYTNLTTPERTGYDFVGWFTQDGTGSNWGDEITKNTSVATLIEDLYAKWSIKTFTVTFESNDTSCGNVVASADNLTITVNYGTIITVADNVITLSDRATTYTATKAIDDGYSYSFDSWSVENNTTITSDLTITATFNKVANTYNVDLHLDGGIVNSVGWAYKDSQDPLCDIVTNTYTYGNSLTLPTPTKAIGLTQYSFVGWYTGNGTPSWGDKVELILATQYGDITLYARWSSQYVISFNQNTTDEVTGMPDNGMVEPNDPFTIPNATPQRTGYTFSSWNTLATGEGGTTYNPGDEIEHVTASTILYARWTVNQYDITFVDDDGSTVLKAATKYNYGTLAADIVKPDDPTKASTAQYSYTFAGWTPAVANVTGDATYRATYTPTLNNYTVTIVVNYEDAGSVDVTSVENVPYGTTISSSNNTVTINGTLVTATTNADNAQYEYSFSSWTNGTATVVGATTVTANFARTTKSYTVTWKNGDTVLETDTNVLYGTTPTYDGETPTKAATSFESYVFDTWSPAVASVTGDATYTALFTVTKYYTLKIGERALLTEPIFDSVKNEYLFKSDVAAGETIWFRYGDDTKTFTNISGNVTTSGDTRVIKDDEANAHIYIKVTGTDTYDIYISESWELMGTHNMSDKDEWLPGTLMYHNEDGTYTVTAEFPANGKFKIRTPGHWGNDNGEAFPDSDYLINNASTGVYVITATFSWIDTVRQCNITCTLKQYNITFKNENGTDFKAEALYNYGTTNYSLESTPSKANYIFVGWTDTHNNIYYTLPMATEDMVYTATFVKALTISSSVNEGEYGSVSPTSLENVPSGATISIGNNVVTVSYTEIGYSQTITATPTDNTNQYHYSFASWSDVANGTITSNLAITANFNRELRSYQVTLNPNSGVIDNGYNVTTYTYGTAETLPTAEHISRDGYTFGGWYDNNTFTGDPVLSITTTDYGTKAFYAKWRENLVESRISLESSSIVYNGLAQNPNVTVTNAALETLVLGTDYTLSAGNKDVGNNYTVTITGIGNYAGAVAKTYSITAAPLTITADNKSVTYNDAIPTYTVTITGFVNNEDASVLGGETGYSCSYAVASPVGSYTITPSGLTSSNYNITFVAGTLTVNNATITGITIAASNLNYSGAAQQATLAAEPTATTVDSCAYEFTYSSTFDGEYSTTLPTAYTNPGTQTLYYKVSAANHTTVSGSVEFNILAKITYDANGGTGTTNPSYGLNGNVALASNSFAKTGYSFVNWNTQADGNGVDYAEAAEYALTTVNVTLYAKWSANSYTITLDDNEAPGDYSVEVTATYDSPMPTITNLPTWEGKAFAGFFAGLGGTGTQYYNADGTSALAWNRPNDAHLYAKWEEKYSVTFNYNYGEPAQTVTQFYNKTDNENVNAPVIERTGYTYEWYDAATGGNVVPMNGNVTSSDYNGNTYYAQWTAITYTITYELNGGTASNPTSYTIETATFTLTNPTKGNYTFAGWTGTGLDSATPTVTISSGSTGDREYTATWRENILESRITMSASSPLTYTGLNQKPTVTSIVNSSSNPLSVGTDYTVTYNTDTWIDAGNYSVTITGSGNYAGTVVLNYTIKAVLHYNANDGSGTMDDDDHVLNDEFALKTNTFTRAGYDFVGWGVAANSTSATYSDGGNITLTSNEITVYALWSGYVYLDYTDLTWWYCNENAGGDSAFAYAAIMDMNDACSWVKLEYLDNYRYKLSYPVGSTKTNKLVFVRAKSDLNTDVNGDGWSNFNQTIDIPMSTALFGSTIGFKNYKYNGKEGVTFSNLVNSGNFYFLLPNSNWISDSARFAVYAYNSDQDNKWFNMIQLDGTNYYLAPKDLIDNYQNVIFVRMNPSTSDNKFDSGFKWNQSSSSNLSSVEGNLYTINDGTWNEGGGTWTVYSD